MSSASSVPGAVLDAGGAKVDRPGPWRQGGHSVVGATLSEEALTALGSGVRGRGPQWDTRTMGTQGRPSRPAWEGLVKLPEGGKMRLVKQVGRDGRAFLAVSVGGLEGPSGGEGPGAGEVGRDQTREGCRCPVGDSQFTQKLALSLLFIYFNVY